MHNRFHRQALSAVRYEVTTVGDLVSLLYLVSKLLKDKDWKPQSQLIYKSIAEEIQAGQKGSCAH